ncbi:MAG: hypothetical protein CVT49_03725 [candidate division Zixibacteria bacterium HGW-Zixibacteria-1]|nr:MAG: hypothetical protein CVT49_03725 [candidate division Zixibacteria bacterium HGW-Zixibacteria-1]
MKQISLTFVMVMLIIIGGTRANDFDIGRQYGLGGSVLLSSPTATDMLTCPTGVMNKNEIIFEAGYQRKFELADLDKIYTAAGYRYKNLSAVIGFSQFGKSDYYVEQTAKGVFSYSINHFAAAIIADGRQVSIGEAESKVTLRAASVGLAAGINYQKYHLGAAVDNINRPRLAQSLAQENSIYHIYAEVEGLSRFSVTGHIAFEESEKPLASFGQYIRLIDNNALFWGVSSNPLTYGGGLDIKYGNYGLIYAVSYHPELGMTHNVSLNISSGKLLH